MNVDLSETSRQLLQDERDLLADLLVLLGKVEGSESELQDLRNAIADLDGAFMLVVAGEYNAGKSTLLNALLGMKVMPDGVTPTTDKVTVISWGEEIREHTLGRSEERRVGNERKLQRTHTKHIK